MNTTTESQPIAAPTEPRRFLHPILAIGWVIGSYIVATVIAQLVMMAYTSSQHMSPEAAQRWLEHNTAAQFVYTLLAYGLLTVPIVWVLRTRGMRLRDIGLRMPRFSDVGWGVIMLPAYFITYGILLTFVSVFVTGLNVDQKQQIGFGSVTHGFDLVLTFLSLAVIPPVVEELTMRGFLFTNLRARMRLAAAVVLTSGLFAVGHLQFGSGAPLLWVAAIDTFVLSLFLIYLRVRTNSLWASICLHAFKNTVAFVMIFVLHKG